MQCFRVTPYCYGDELFLDLQQIIPPPEAADYTISLASKEAEEADAQGTQKRRHDLRLQFWARALERLRADGLDLFARVNPTKDHWLSAGSGVRACPFQMIFGQREARVELSLNRSEAAENKWLFDQLFSQRAQIEAAFGHPLDWRRMDDKQQSRIVFAQTFDGYNKEFWPEMVAWLSEHIRALEKAFQEPLTRAGRQLRVQDEADT